MKLSKKSRVRSYIAAPLMAVAVFTIASLVFTFILKNPAPVPVFIVFGTIQLCCMTLYSILPSQRGKRIARLTSMFIIGLFIVVLAGILGRNNFQLEGFFFYVTSGTFSGILIHFIMAKIIGPIFYSRNWCSWGCWTSMILDLLPYKTNTTWKKGMLPLLRYVHFAISLLVVTVLYFVFKTTIIHTDPDTLKKGIGTGAELIWFVTGNALYYLIGIVLAFKLRDNRAFCKYICPVTVFLKMANRFTLLRIAGKKEITCDNCRSCVKHCPMGIDIPTYIKNSERVKSSECILCMNCIGSCPNGLLTASVGIDFANKDYLHY